MKKLLLSIACLFTAGSLYGQAARSTVQVGPDHKPTAPLDLTGAGITLPVDPRIANALRNYQAETVAAIDSAIVGKTAGAATQNIFSAGDLTAGTGYVRNTNIFIGVDLTCFSPWNSRNQNYEGGVAISPLHVLLADHYSNPSHGSSPMIPNSTTIRFVDNANNIYERTFVQFTQVGASDVLIGKLNAPLPSSIKPAKILPLNLGYHTLMGQASNLTIPVLTSNFGKQLFIAESASDDPITTSYIQPAAATNRVPWTRSPSAIGGDSGSPIFIVINGEAVIWSVFHYSNGGDSVSQYTSDLSNILISGGQALAIENMNTVMSDPRAIKQGDSAYFSSLYADGHVAFGAGATFNVYVDDDGDSEPAISSIIATDSYGAPIGVPLAASESVRRNSAGTGFESFVPTDLLTASRPEKLWDYSNDQEALVVEEYILRLQLGYNLTNSNVSAGLDDSGFFGNGSRLTDLPLPTGITDLGDNYWSLGKALEFFGDRGIYGDGPDFVWNDGQVVFGYGGNHIYGDLALGQVTANSFAGDGSGLFNLPPPAGLLLDNQDGGDNPSDYGLITNNQNEGDFSVGAGSLTAATVVLSAPNTLGPLDGSALTVGGEPVFGNDGGSAYFDSNGSAFTAYSANQGNNSFDAFFQQNGYNTDTSLPGDGTASFANGNFTIGSGGNFSSDGGNINTNGSGDMYFNAAGGGILLTSHDGNVFKISIDESGSFVIDGY